MPSGSLKSFSMASIIKKILFNREIIHSRLFQDYDTNVDGNTSFETFTTMYDNKLDELSDLRKGRYIASIKLH